MLILVNNQLALFSMYLFIYFTSLHVSSNTGIPGSHLHRTIYTRWCINTIRFSWWALGC